MSLGEEAQKLENAGKEMNSEYIGEHHEGFIETYRSFKDLKEMITLKGVQKFDDSYDKPLADAYFINKIYNDLEKDRALRET